MSGQGLRYASTALMPSGMRQMAEKALAGAERIARAVPKERAEAVSEHIEARRLMDVVRAHEASHPELAMLYAVPNGGDRHKLVAAKMKAEGQRPGVPDYALPVARAGFHGLYIELKSLDGSPSREQRDWISRLRAEGYRAEVARGHDAAWAILRGYLGIP